MVVLGLDNAVFWAFLIFIASYIPIIGRQGILAPPIFALIQFEPICRPLSCWRCCRASSSWWATWCCRACRVTA
jgi:hypothetical protein